MNRYEKVFSTIESCEDAIVDYAVNLVRFPTTSGNEKGAQAYVKTIMTDLAFDPIDMWEPDIEKMRNHPAFISKRKDFKGSPNVVGILRGTGGGKSLILNSHIDIVPEGDPDQWHYPPFGGIVENGVIYGRGISDMKGTKAAIFGAIQALRKANIRVKGDITVQSVIEEETGSAGTLACALKGYQADAAIIPEPSGFKICPAQQGSSWFRIHVRGKSAHAGQRYLGVNAITKSTRVLTAIKTFEDHINKEYTSFLYKNIPIPFAINIGNIKGGEWPSTVPEHVVVEGRMGVPPGLSLNDAWEMFERWIKTETANDTWLAENQPTVEWFGAHWGPAQIDPKHAIVKTATEAYSKVCETSPKIAGTPWATDGRILTEFADTPALVFGPGTSAHCPDEFMKIKDLICYAKILAAIIIDWCETDAL